VFADAELKPEQYIVVGILVLVALVGLVFCIVFARLFSLWLQSFLSGARISFLNLILMMLRRTPAKQVVRAKIMAVQSGLAIPTHDIESAILQGADVERAVLAMIRARDIGQEVTWKEIISLDATERLKKKLFDQ
jgi:uncharacterized protein YqfA (UPF0365 family)